MQDFSSEDKNRINENLDKEFYSDKSGYGHIDSIEEFRELPTMRKEDLADEDDFVMFEEYRDEARIFNYTSGTTRHPTIVLRSEKGVEIEKEKVLKHIDLYAGERNYVVISATIALTGMISAFRERDILSGYSTPYNLGFSVGAIKQLDIDTLWATPSLALKIGEMLQEEDERVSSIDTVVLTGEPLSNLGYRKLEELYSGADVYMTYGGMEDGHRAYQCEHLKGTNCYHPFTDRHFFEVLEFESDEPKKDGFGELVTTRLWSDCCIPIVRYRTGDRARWKDSECECGEGPIMEVGGRTVFDSFKMSGFTVYRENFEKSLDSVADMISSVYQIHVKEVEEDGKVMPKLEIHLKPAESLSRELVDEKEVVESISENFQITEEHFYQDMCDKGVFSELEVVLKDSIVSDAKTQLVIDHRSS